jgi:hypothetical protein
MSIPKHSKYRILCRRKFNFLYEVGRSCYGDFSPRFFTFRLLDFYDFKASFFFIMYLFWENKPHLHVYNGVAKVALAHGVV